MTWDIAMMMPMIEMAGDRHTYIDDILYIYNDNTPLNDDKINKQLQSYLARVLRAKKPYQKLKQSSYNKSKSNVSVLILSQENPLQLYACLESIFLNVKNVSIINVIYRSHDIITHKGYEFVKKEYPSVQFYEVNKTHSNLKEILKNVLANTKSKFTIFTTDKIVVTKEIDVYPCLESMKKTHAYAFHFRLGDTIKHMFPSYAPIEIPDLITIDPNIFAWNFKYAEADWAYASNTHFTLYWTDELRKVFKKLMFYDIDSLEIQWANTTDLDHVGLCYNNASVKKVYWINQNHQGYTDYYTPKDLTDYMTQELKIDIKALIETTQTTSSIEVVPTFVKIR